MELPGIRNRSLCNFRPPSVFLMRNATASSHASAFGSRFNGVGAALAASDRISSIFDNIEGQGENILSNIVVACSHSVRSGGGWSAGTMEDRGIARGYPIEFWGSSRRGRRLL